MRVTVFGGTGFVGNYLVDELLAPPVGPYPQTLADLPTLRNLHDNARWQALMNKHGITGNW